MKQVQSILRGGGGRGVGGGERERGVTVVVVVIRVVVRSKPEYGEKSTTVIAEAGIPCLLGVKNYHPALTLTLDRRIGFCLCHCSQLLFCRNQHGSNRLGRHASLH